MRCPDAEPITWASCLKAAVREMNRRPMEAMANWSPTELLFGFTIREARTSTASQAPDKNTLQRQQAFIDVARVDASVQHESMQSK